MTEPRSWLFVPADSEKKIAKALDSEADGIIFDLEDSVAPDAKVKAREVLATNPLPPMTSEEIQAEIDAYRAEVRRAARP